jgi:hypothetical protein
MFNFKNFQGMISMFLGLYLFIYFSVKCSFDSLIKNSSKKVSTLLDTDIIGKSLTKINYKKLNKAKKSSDSLVDLLDEKQDDSFKEIAKRLG